ncbi:MAG: protein phosphatase 2C domain-containing protein [Oscillospiraceae bacterium]|nr:protein phosphatase 2C domain-containing protein [Oscillospiraceae bacterium]
MLQNTRFKGYALSVRGASHEEDGSPCQDSARVFTSEGFAVAAVSDGHGSEKHFRSASGSEMATRVAIRSICDFAERNNGLDGIFRTNPTNAARRIAANIICGWNNEIAAHISLLPLTESERAVYDKYGGIPNEVMYGATLIVAGITENGCFGLQIGDGSFVALNGGKMFFPVPEDTKLVGNLTTSLCDSNAIDSFRSFYHDGSFSGVSLSSDGLINSFVNIDDFLKFGRRILTAVENNTATALGEHLKMRSRCGSRDDISVAAISVNS